MSQNKDSDVNFNDNEWFEAGVMSLCVVSVLPSNLSVCSMADGYTERCKLRRD